MKRSVFSAITVCNTERWMGMCILMECSEPLSTVSPSIRTCTIPNETPRATQHSSPHSASFLSSPCHVTHPASTRLMSLTQHWLHTQLIWFVTESLDIHITTKFVQNNAQMCIKHITTSHDVQRKWNLMENSSDYMTILLSFRTLDITNWQMNTVWQETSRSNQWPQINRWMAQNVRFPTHHSQCPLMYADGW